MKIIDEKQPKVLKISQPPESKHPDTLNYDLKTGNGLAIKLDKINTDEYIDLFRNEMRKFYGFEEIEKMIFDKAKNTKARYVYLKYGEQKNEINEENYCYTVSVEHELIESDVRLIGIEFFIEPLRWFIREKGIETLEQLNKHIIELQEFYKPFREFEIKTEETGEKGNGKNNCIE